MEIRESLIENPRIFFIENPRSCLQSWLRTAGSGLPSPKLCVGAGTGTINRTNQQTIHCRRQCFSSRLSPGVALQWSQNIRTML